MFCRLLSMCGKSSTDSIISATAYFSKKGRKELPSTETAIVTCCDPVGQLIRANISRRLLSVPSFSVLQLRDRRVRKGGYDRQCVAHISLLAQHGGSLGGAALGDRGVLLILRLAARFANVGAHSAER